jgi:hypothetical protein
VKQFRSDVPILLKFAQPWFYSRIENPQTYEPIESPVRVTPPPAQQQRTRDPDQSTDRSRRGFRHRRKGNVFEKHPIHRREIKPARSALAPHFRVHRLTVAGNRASPAHAQSGLVERTCRGGTFGRAWISGSRQWPRHRTTPWRRRDRRCLQRGPITPNRDHGRILFLREFSIQSHQSHRVDAGLLGDR